MEYINRVVTNIIHNDVETLLISLDEIIDEGKDIDNFVWEVIKYIKDILVYKAAKEIELYNKEEREAISQLSQEVTKERLLALIYILSELANIMKWSSQKVIVLQSGLIKACVQENEMGHSPRLDIKESKKEDTKTTKEAKKELEKTAIEKLEEKDSPTHKKPDKNSEEGALQYWPKILETLKTKGKVMLYTNLIGTNAKKVSDSEVAIEFGNKITPFTRAVLEQRENKEEITKMITQEEGESVQIKYVEANSGIKVVPKNEKEYTEGIGIPINIINE